MKTEEQVKNYLDILINHDLKQNEQRLKSDLRRKDVLRMRESSRAIDLLKSKKELLEWILKDD